MLFSEKVESTAAVTGVTICYTCDVDKESDPVLPHSTVT